MPFQIVSTSYQVGAPPVVLLTAGDDQSVFCGGVVALEATVDEPDNLPGHTLEWEQLTGNPVILSCPTCIATTYPLNDLTQKTFRFWIDRGLPAEQYDDVTVFHTPQTTMEPGAFAEFDGSESTYGVASSSPLCADIVITVLAAPDEQSSQVPGALGLAWPEVVRTDLRPFVTQYTVLENGIGVQTSLVNEPREYLPALEATYQILTEFIVNGAYSSELSCVRDYIDDLPYPSVIVIDDYMAGGAFYTPPPSVVKFGNIVNNEGESTYEPGAFEGFDGSYVTTVQYDNIVIFEPESTFSNGASDPTEGGVLTITRFDSGSIGG